MKAKVSKSRIMVWLVKLLAILLVVSLVPITMAVKASADDGQKEEVELREKDKIEPISNKLKGTLIVEKDVKDEKANEKKRFKFEVMPKKETEGDDIIKYPIQFDLGHGEQKTLELKSGLEYLVKELNPDGYEVAGRVVDKNSPNEFSVTGKFDGAETTVKLQAGITTIVTFVNTPVPTPEPGANFTVVKKVDGIEGSLQKFRFVLWVQGMEGEKFEGLEFDDKARAKFQLAAGDELVLENLPAKREFELTELPADYYTPHFSVEQGMADETKDGVRGCTLDTPTVILVINKFAGFDPIDDEILPLTIDVKAKKIWEGGAGPRPDVEFELYREVPDGHGVKLEKVPDVATLKIVDGETEVVWPKLRRCNSEEVEYNYYVIELTELDDYKMERVDYLTIKNVYLGGSETDPPTDDGGDPPPAGDEGPGTGEEGPGELVLGESIELGSGDVSGPGEKVLGEEDVKAPATGEQLSVYLYLALLMTAISLLFFWKGRRAVEKE